MSDSLAAGSTSSVPPVDAAAKEGPFAPAGPGARPTPVWATPITQALLYLASALPIVVFVVVYFVGLQATGQGVEGRNDDLLLVASLVIQFPTWIILAVVWIRKIERRSLASAGFQSSTIVKSYGIGLGVGLGVVIVMGALASLVAPQAEPIATPDPSLITSPAWLTAFAGVLALFLVQGASEEVAFRGWMMSAVGLRRGLIAAVVVNTAAFAALHVHFFRADTLEISIVFVAIVTVVTLAGWLGRWGLIGGLVAGAIMLALTPWTLTPADLAFGLVAMSAVGCVGLFLSLWAISERSIVGVCGIHGAFNASAVLGGMIAAAGENPETTPWRAFIDTLGAATAIEGETNIAAAAVQLLVFATLSALVWLRLKRKGRL